MPVESLFPLYHHWAACHCKTFLSIILLTWRPLTHKTSTVACHYARLCYVIGLICNDKDGFAYTILLTAWLQLCFLMNICSYITYDSGSYTELAYQWVWLILIIMYNPIGYHTTNICIYLMLYINGEPPVPYKILSLHSILLWRHIVSQNLYTFCCYMDHLFGHLSVCANFILGHITWQVKIR